MSSFVEHRIRVPDGLSLYVRDYAPPGAPKGEPVLCLHGLTRNSKDFEATAPWIAGLGRRVLAWDTRGRGQSDWDPQPMRYQAPIYVGDVMAVLEELAIPRAVFLGTSMGGLITMILAAIKPELIVAGILNDIGPIIDPRGIARISGYAGKTGPFPSWRAIADQIKALQGPYFPDADDEFWLTFARRSGKERPEGGIVFDYDPDIRQAFAAAPDPAPDLMPFFAALGQKPVLAIRGALSDILPVEGVAAMRAAMPDLAFTEVPRVGHAPTLEEYAAKRAIAEFLEKVG
jgi:pimeloyl-ACP methyl ester carboxylesterase